MYTKGVFFSVCVRVVSISMGAFGVWGSGYILFRGGLDGERAVRACVRMYSVALSCGFHGSVVFDR